MNNRKKIYNVRPEIKEALKNIGFTDYYISIYLCLLEEGQLDARKLSEKTNVPYSRIYEVLNEMSAKGIITKIEGRPSIFIAVPPFEMFRNLKNRMEQEFTQNMNISKAYLEELYKPTGALEEFSSVLLKGKESCMVYLKNTIRNTSISLLAAFRHLDVLRPYLASELKFLHAKRANIKFIIDVRESSDPWVEELRSYGEIRFASGHFPIFIVSDDIVLVMIESGKFNIIYPDSDDFLGYSCKNRTVAAMTSETFKKIWNTPNNGRPVP